MTVRFPPGRHLGQSQAETRGVSGYQTPAELRDQAEIMGVVLNQPHRIGISSFPADKWMLTALGRFCAVHWKDKGTQHDYWLIGERYAQLIDAERIARGWPPRQCAESTSLPEPRTLQEALKRRDDMAKAVTEANEEILTVDKAAVGAIYRLAWEDRGILDRMHGIAFNALYRLSVYFEREDRPRARA